MDLKTNNINITAITDTIESIKDWSWKREKAAPVFLACVKRKIPSWGQEFPRGKKIIIKNFDNWSKIIVIMDIKTDIVHKLHNHIRISIH